MIKTCIKFQWTLVGWREKTEDSNIWGNLSDLHSLFLLLNILWQTFETSDFFQFISDINCQSTFYLEKLRRFINSECFSYCQEVCFNSIYVFSIDTNYICFVCCPSHLQLNDERKRKRNENYILQQWKKEKKKKKYSSYLMTTCY